MKKIWVLFTISVLLIGSCKKIVTPVLANAPVETVIEGNIDNRPGPYTVSINQTVNFYSDNSFPPVSGAEVLISSDQGLSDSLTETSPGIYTGNVLTGIPDHVYTLRVTTGNKTYTAESTMPGPVALDSVSFLTVSGFGQQRTNVVVNFQDPPGINNYYRFEEFINGDPYIKSFFIFSDRLSDGKYISLALRTDSTYFHPGDLIDVKMHCIDQNVYNYFEQLQQSNAGGTFNTTVSPANPTTNFSGGTLGYFSAQTTSETSAVAP